VTLRYQPKSLHSLSTSMGRSLALTVTDPQSTLRLYTEAEWEQKGIRFLDEPSRRRFALFEAR